MKSLSLFLLLPILLFGENTKLQFRTGYLNLKDNRARKIYNNGGIEVEVEAATQILCGLDLWGNVNYFWKNGHSIGLKEPTHLDLYNLSLGLKRIFSLSPPDCFFFYLGLGATMGFLRVKDHSDFVEKHRDKTIFGGVAKSGFLYFFNCSFFLDLFTDYYYQPSHFKGDRSRNIIGNDPDLGGFRFGLGLGGMF